MIVTQVCMGRRGCPTLTPPHVAPAVAGERRGSPPPLWLLHPSWGWIWVCVCLPVLLGLLLLPLPRYPSGGGIGILLHIESRSRCPPFAIPQGPGGRRRLVLWRGLPPPRRCCPLPHQPEGDALKNIEQPLRGGRGG